MTCSFEEDSIYKKHFSGKINVEKQASIMSFHSDSNPPRTKCVIAQAQLIQCVCLSYKQLGSYFRSVLCALLI